MDATAIILKGPKQLAVQALRLREPGPTDIVVQITHTGISTGTEKLFWSGQMPPFPGMGYPLVPGYEAVGEVIEAGDEAPFDPGDRVFVPGSDGFEDARGLFGAAARILVVPAHRVIPVNRALDAEAVLLALAATARHALAGLRNEEPDLIVGHGTLGRLLARLTLVAGGPPPTVWEVDETRQAGAMGYNVIHPDDDPRRDYAAIYDVSGDAGLLDTLIARLAKGGEIVLAGFYPKPLSFAFPPAFMREARLRIAAEWTHDDLMVTANLVNSGALSLSGLITHRAAVADAPAAYAQAFTDPACLKMILDWKGTA